MNVFVHSDARPEAMADVPGVCELPLTRAVVQYRDVHEIEVAGGRIQDIGLGLVLEGRYASSAEVVDLGSGDVKRLDLSAELVVLDWVYEPTLEHASRLLRDSAGSGESTELERFCFQMAFRVLERVGFGPLTRPTLLRVGFRDICRDLDLHEGTSVRFDLGAGRVLRAHLDYDSSALLFRSVSRSADPAIEVALGEAFPGGELRHFTESGGGRTTGYQIRLPLPLSLSETRDRLMEVRAGLLRLVARFEPERARNVERLVNTFGRRETLARLHLREPAVRYAPVQGAPGSTVH